MSGHVADLVSRADLRDVAEERIRRIRLELDWLGHLDVFGVENPAYMYVPPGPVAQAFLNDRTPTCLIMGPLGGGKTTTCTFKRIVAATLAPIAWHPEDAKPTRMCRWIVLRDTFRSAEKTVLESWKQWFPKNYPGSTSVGGNDRPLTHTLRFMGDDGVRVEAITEFAGLNEQSIETLMKGREYSGGWLNELDTHAEGALDDMEQRVGRYPKADILLTPREIAELEAQLQAAGRLRPGQRLYAPERRLKTVIGDMNAPTVDNWTYETLVLNRGPDRAFHQQPSGRSAAAENIFNLEPDYYDRIIANQDERFVRRMVDNEFGYSRAGKPVHPSFDHRRHVADRELALDEGLDLHIGIDVSLAGLSPAAVFGQAATRIKLLDELYLGHGVGPARFAEALRLMLQERFPNVAKSRIKPWVDPASEFGADRDAGQLNALQIFQDVLGVPVRVPGNGSNELGLRLSAVDAELRGYLEADSWLLISPRCKLYIEGIAGKYRFKKKPESATNEYEDLPEKAHPWSDLQDAGQYLFIGVRGHMGVVRGATSGRLEPEGQQGWASQRNGQQGWRSQGGFDPHRAGARK